MSINKKTASYDVIVVGGGMAGMCAAIAAARGGAKTAIVQNRSMFGGNASSEIRMHICGANCHSSKPNMRETGILEEILLETAPDPEEKLREIVARKYQRQLQDEKGYRRTVAALQRLGYGWEDIKSVVEEFRETGE